jgi:DNA primase
MVLLQLPAEVGAERAARVVQVPFANPSLGVVKDAIASQLATLTEPGWVDRITAEVPAPFAPLVNELSVASVPQAETGNLTGYAQSVAGALIERDLLREKAELQLRLRRTDDPETVRTLGMAMMHIETERRRLREE